MKSYEENKLLGGASCKNHIFLNAFALVLVVWFVPEYRMNRVAQLRKYLI
jgi:hypothetical protein